jgi:hypothetical protein
MCPLCLTTLAVLGAGAASGGGLTALVVNGSRPRNSAELVPNPHPKEASNATSDVNRC